MRWHSIVFRTRAETTDDLIGARMLEPLERRDRQLARVVAPCGLRLEIATWLASSAKAWGRGFFRVLCRTDRRTAGDPASMRFSLKISH